MAKQAYLGNKIRRLRKEADFTQVELAKQLEISPSYLNLIEKNQRALTVPLLLRLAEIFGLDLKTFAEDDEARLAADLREAFSDPLFEGRNLRDADIRDVLASAPVVAEAVIDLYREFRKSRETTQELASRLSSDEELSVDGTSPAEEVSDAIQRARNYYAPLETLAGEVRRDAGIDAARGGAFSSLVGIMENRFGVQVSVVPSQTLGGSVRRYDPERKRLALSEALPSSSQTFQLAHQVALLAAREPIREIVDAGSFNYEDSERLYAIALANYTAAAILMPYDRFLEAAVTNRYDIELLEHRFRASFEQVCHRLTTLQAPNREGIPFHLVRVDIAGNISKRFSASGIPFARYSGACSLWSVHAAFLTPGFIRTQLSEMPDNSRYFSIARTVRKAGGGFQVRQSRLALELGCEAKHAENMVYADGVDLSGRAAVPVGVSCRLCERMDCRQRAFPPMHQHLAIDENVRGLSFYYSSGPRR